MFFCDVVQNNKLYRVSVTMNETVTSVVEKEIRKNPRCGCIVYENDGITPCEDLYIRKRIGDVAKRHIEVRLKAMEKFLGNTT